MTARVPLVVLLVSLPLIVSTQPPPHTFVITNVNLVAMVQDGVQAGQTVLVRDGRIAAIGDAARVPRPEGAEEIDGTGKWLMPGLAEMHAHIPPGQATLDDMRRMLELNVLNGITTVRGMLGDPRHLELRAQASRGEFLSPVIRTSGPSINGTSASSADVVTRMVREQKAAGYDFLKIHPGVKREVFDAMAATADASHIRFAGHVPLDVGLARALEARFETIDHVDGYVEALLKPDAPVKATDSQWFGVNLIDHVDESRMPALVDATKKAGTWIVPTETLFESTVGETAPEAMAQWPEMRWVTPAQIAQWTEWKRTFIAKSQLSPESRARFLAVRKRLIEALHDGGVGMLLGADAPQMWNVPGFATHRELQAMVRAGLTPAQALAMGTRNVAAFHGERGDSGVIAVGKRADLLLLAANPLEDVANTTRIDGVMAGGRWLPKAEIERRLAALAIPR